MQEKTNWFTWGIAAVVVVGLYGLGIWQAWFRPYLSAFHVIISLSLILIVLLQSGRAADLAGAFGGSGSQTAFGPRGAASFLSQATEFLAIAFMFSALVLGVISTQALSAGSSLPATAPGVEQSAPEAAAPADELPGGEAEGGEPAADAAGTQLEE